jgi:hypothetical protein
MPSSQIPAAVGIVEEKVQAFGFTGIGEFGD